MTASINQKYECSVCLDEMTGNEWRSMKLVAGKCNHIFHSKCIKGWLEGATTGVKKNSCPLCNGKIEVSDLKSARKIFKAQILKEEAEEPLMADKIYKVDPKKSGVVIPFTCTDCTIS